MSITQEDLKKVLKNDRKKKIKAKWRDGRETIKRIAQSMSGRMMFMDPRSRTRGRILDTYDLNNIQSVEPVIESKKTPEEKWLHQLNRAIKMLEQSKIWPNLLEEMKIAKEIGYNTLQKAYKLSWVNYEGDYYEQNKKRVVSIKQIAPQLIKVNEEGREFYNTEILWHFSYPLKIKKMNFGKHYNEFVLTQIKEAIKKNKKYSTGRYRTSYDTSFEYNPECKKAWYSEEFKDCGNGHYYLALNETHAMHYEDD